MQPLPETPRTPESTPVSSPGDITPVHVRSSRRLQGLQPEHGLLPTPSRTMNVDPQSSAAASLALYCRRYRIASSCEMHSTRRLATNDVVIIRRAACEPSSARAFSVSTWYLSARAPLVDAARTIHFSKATNLSSTIAVHATGHEKSDTY
ncbi:hypothetical protein HPB50_003556 [Hyalomma asiaticum]|uniref:Uncharacterized protein n=1 Tax=Hyalomma asiaticum TaxID=266040 RepID=A0ACB7SUJ8_HYAAI|nr:hypothetical protein HPB50_003556 [Hyalomma asiaticum]